MALVVRVRRSDAGRPSEETCLTRHMVECKKDRMQIRHTRLRKAPIVLLSCLLFVQLSGLTCIQDASASPFAGSSAGSGAVISDPSPESLPASGDDPGDSLYHDCPCHHLVSLQSATINSTVSLRSSIAHASFSVPEDLPQVLFHPPLL
jgi:hypothetical protein